MLDKILERIDQRLEVLGLSESRAATMAGLSNSTIRGIRRRVKAGEIHKSVEIRTLEALARTLETSAAWLVDGDGESDLLKEERGGNHPEIKKTDIPLISWVSAGQADFQEGIDGFAEFPTIAAYDLPRGEWIALRVDGQSMNKVSPHDSIIFVNMEDKDLVPNAYYVIMDETRQVTYKRYRPNEEPPFQPFSTQNIPPPKLIGSITILGRVRRTITEM